MCASFKDNIWAADLAETESLSSKNQGVKYLCVRDVFTKYAWAKPFKDKRSKTVLNGFIEILNESKRKPNKRNPMQKWFDDNNILMYSMHN